jgi:hypothetical protein
MYVYIYMSCICVCVRLCLLVPEDIPLPLHKGTRMKRMYKIQTA